jgi:peptide/nickel transport system ATP-binding protein
VALLELQDLSLHYHTGRGVISAVNQLSLALDAGESLGLVGESGSGKSSIAHAILRLLPAYAQIRQGRIYFAGRNLLDLTEPQMREVRWRQIAMVFQAAMNTLNPMYTVGAQVVETILTHEPNMSSKAARARVEELYALVGLPCTLLRRYPHEYSGGMKQRACIALALACNPQLIIADEPTTALDVIMQARILGELESIRKERGMSVIYISHDMAMMAQVAERIGVMYAGVLVEYGCTIDLLAAPAHPYTAGLLAAVPSMADDVTQLQEIPGEPVDLYAPPAGCRFYPRCSRATAQCKEQAPPLLPCRRNRDGEHKAACWHLL